MQTTALFTTAFVVGLSGAMMPGPLLTATMVSSAERSGNKSEEIYQNSYFVCYSIRVGGSVCG
jgi:hypothetical protein